MISSDRKKKKKGKNRNNKGWVKGTIKKTGRGLVPPTIESMREPRMSRSEAPEMGRIGDTMPWNQGNPH